MNRLISIAKFVVPALLIAGAAQADGLQDQAIAMRYVTCLAHAADKYDDGISDAAIIATRITPVCAEQFSREETAFSAGLSVSEQATYRDAMTSQQPQLAQNVVAEERSWNRAHHHAMPNRVAQND
jgi:hypothetical protein